MNPPAKISATELPLHDASTGTDDERVMSLVELALLQPAESRGAYLRSACDGDAELLARVLTCVRAEERMGGFLLEPLFNPASLEDPFAPGDVLDQRFRIVREIARGGMGIVYEAFDQKLERPIAIKCAQAGFRKRLTPEVRNASEISHPNVCKIFEIHTTTIHNGGDSGEIDFITMELIAGETLAARLAHGPLSSEEALSIARQLCAGVAEAHRHQVIHGDLKSSNIILSKLPDGSPRAVITDFGLARRPASLQRAAQSGPLGGTPDYMAPELWKGERAAVASDIYALGVILHELVAGCRPFAGQTSWQERLTQPPAPLNRRTMRGTGGATRWDRLLGRCLDPDPTRRFTSAGQILVLLDSAARRARTRRWVFAAAAVAALAAAGSFLVYRQNSAPVESMRLAVLPFTTDAATASLSNGLLHDTADRLSRVQSSRAGFTLIPLTDAVRDKVNRPEDVVSQLGGTHALSGTLRQEHGVTFVHAYLTDARVNVPLAEWSAQYAPDELRDMPVALAGIVTRTLALPPLATMETVNAAAYRDWSQGVALARGDPKDIDRALELLGRAAAVDPDSPLTQARLAEAQWQKYRQTSGEQWWNRANDSLRKAQRRNPDVAPVLFMSGVLNESAGRFPEAEADLDRAIAIDKTNGDFERELANVLRQSDKPAGAVAAYRKAISLQPDYYRNYESLGGFYYDRSEYEEAARMYEKMVSLAPNLSDAHYELSRPYLSIARYGDAERELRTAQRLHETSNVDHALAISLVYQDRFREAIPYFAQALKLGPPPNNLFLLYLNWGSSYRRIGQLAQAKAAYSKALELATRELERKSYSDSYIIACRAYLYARLGNRPLADSDTRFAASRSAKNMSTLWMLVQTYEALGERDRALAAMKDAPQAIRNRVEHFSELAGLRGDPRYIKVASPR